IITDKMLRVDSTRAFTYQWRLWRVLGMHPPEADTFWARHYSSYTLAYILVFNGCVPLSFYLECVLSSNLTEFCETFYLAALIAVEQLKFANVWHVRGQLKRLHMILNRLDARLKSQAERHIIREHIGRSRRIFLWLFRLFLLIIGSAVLFVLCNAEQELPFPAWYPWDWQSSRRVYMMTITMQMLGIIALALMTLNNDTYPVSYLIMVAGHYRALALRISLLGYGPMRSHGRQSCRQLIECIEDHKTILLLVRTMADALATACFYQFICTATALCSLSFYIFYVQMGFSKLLHLFFMFVGIICETLLICYAAEEVNNSAQQISVAIYACNWIDQSLEFRRTMCLMLKRSQRHVGIVAAKVVPVRMDTLLAVRSY
ncbi:hypothetical protein KR222_006456, partial [Zaprionus bogoriensis]